jgi:putative copper export protein
MKLFTDLFTTDYGLVALAFTLVSLALAIAMRLFIVKKMRESQETHSAPKTPPHKD